MAGVGTIVDFVLNEDVDVIIGSPQSAVSAAAGHLTAYWNIPQISWVSTSHVLTDKTIYSTFVRTLGPLSTIGAGVLSIFRHLNWHNIGILHINSGVCLYAVDGVREWLYGTGITIMQTITYMREDLSDTHINANLHLIRKSSRIIFLCDQVNLRRYLIHACAMGMCNGEYVFIGAWAIKDVTDVIKREDDGRDNEAKHAFKYLIYMTIAQYYNEAGRQKLVDFYENVVQRMAEPPWNDDIGLRMNLTGSIYAPFLYDAIYFYGLWINHTTETGNDVRDGRQMFRFSKGLAYNGMSGPVHFDDNGDRVPLYWIWDFTHENGLPRISAVVDTLTKTVETAGWTGFNWQTADGRAPPDTPACGFYNELCIAVPEDNTGIIVGVCLTVLAIMAVGVFVVYIIRKRQIETHMMKMIWKVDLNDVELQKSKIGAGSRINISKSALSTKSDNTGDMMDGQPMTTVAMYKGQMVAVKFLPTIRYNLKRDDLRELQEMREMQNDNVNPFIGANLDSASPSAFFLYCPKGSLQDILENDEIKLDMIFKHSLMLDLIQGMCYLHASKLGSHGRLKSNNCVVDNRWLLKVTDYGMGRFLQYEENDILEEHEKYKSMLWTAPELLKKGFEVCPNGTKAGDVYSCGIILHEIFFRMGPFAGDFGTTFKGIVIRVKNREAIPCRPKLDNATNLPASVVKLMKLCWADNENDRPSYSTIRSYVKRNIQSGKKNIVDIMLQRLEKYACNLEELVDQRTQQLMEEKRKTDSLLYRMMPASCADKLKTGESVPPELYESATVFFSDIVGFTAIAGKSSPLQVVDLLNDLYTHFDEIIERHDAYKVETIGDAYLVVSGIPKRNGDLHAGVIADMSMEILTGLKGFKIRHLPLQRLLVRIGMHTGPCCAGVVGLSMPRYCLFGDTVNTASRMETNGESQKIHLSESAHTALEMLGGYYMTFRKEMEIKGKGLMKTYWLDGNEVHDGTQLLNTVE